MSSTVTVRQPSPSFIMEESLLCMYCHVHLLVLFSSNRLNVNPRNSLSTWFFFKVCFSMTISSLIHMMLIKDHWVPWEWGGLILRDFQILLTVRGRAYAGQWQAPFSGADFTVLGRNVFCFMVFWYKTVFASSKLMLHNLFFVLIFNKVWGNRGNWKCH